jgi:hypothetical protein
VSTVAQCVQLVRRPSPLSLPGPYTAQELTWALPFMCVRQGSGSALLLGPDVVFLGYRAQRTPPSPPPHPTPLHVSRVCGCGSRFQPPAPSLPVQGMIREARHRLGTPSVAATVAVPRAERRRVGKQWRALLHTTLSCAEQTLELLLTTIGSTESRVYAVNMADAAGWTSLHYMARCVGVWTWALVTRAEGGVCWK